MTRRPDEHSRIQGHRDIDASSVATAMALRDDHLRSAVVCDVESHPNISSQRCRRPHAAGSAPK